MSLLTAAASRRHPLIQRLAACPLALTMLAAELGKPRRSMPHSIASPFAPCWTVRGGCFFPVLWACMGPDVVVGLAGPDPPPAPGRGWSSSSAVPRCLPNRGMPRTATSPQCAFASAPFLAHTQAHNSSPLSHTHTAATSTSHATTHGVHNPPSPPPSLGGCGTSMVPATAASRPPRSPWPPQRSCRPGRYAPGALPAPAC